ncbi:MAG: S-layer homology domain-containing protein, partial [Candidatus Ornithomonoglobus sp.]
MKMNKIMCAALAAAAAVSAAPAAMAGGTDFCDVSESHWAYEYISSMAARGIIEGYDDGSFLPEKTVTRAEFAKMLAGAAALSPAEASFGDVSEDAWYLDYVRAASAYLVPEGDMFLPE